MRTSLERHLAVIETQDWPKSEKQWLASRISEELTISPEIDRRALTPQYRWNLCVERLKDGLFNDWDGFEYRSDWAVTFRGFNGFETIIQKWDGYPVDRITVLGEQGLGDEILFFSALPELIVRLGTKAIEVQCYPQLRSIVEQSFKVRTSDRKTLSKVASGDALVALGDLFPFYRRDKSHFPRKPYLKPDPDKVLYWKSWLKNFGEGRKVGIAWYSRHGFVDPKSLMTDPSAVYFDLQYRKPGIDASEIPDSVISPPFDVGNDFDNLFAFCKALDSMNSVTQTLVHVCGSIGTECHAVIPPKNGEVVFSLWYHDCKILGDSKSWPHLIYPSVSMYEDINEFRRSRCAG